MNEKIGNKKKYNFTEDETEDIINKYKSGLSCNTIAKDYPCSSKTIERFLRKQGISAKDNPNNIFINDLPQKEKEYIIDSYLNGVSACKLGEQYHCNEGTIRHFLKINNITYKDAKHCHLKEFNEETIADIINKYISGVSIKDLTIEYDCNFQTINKLIPQDIKLKYKSNKSYKSLYRTKHEITQLEKEEIISKYQDGVFQKELAYTYNCSIRTIASILKEFNLSGKDNPKWGKDIKQFDKDTKETIVQVYKSGVIQEDLAKQYNCSRDYIRTILYENNCSYEDNPNYNFNISKTLDASEIINLYNQGYSINELSQKYNVSSSVISNILIDNDITIKQNFVIYTDEEMLRFLIDIFNSYGYVDTELLNSFEEYPTSATYNSRFGSFANAMLKAKLPYSTSIKMLDNEVCKSGFEYRLSLVLRKYNIVYERDYLYKNLIPNYNKKHSMDYKIFYKDKIIYSEIFGMCGSTLSNNKYDKTKKIKLQLCNKYNIKLLELYPVDFKYNNEQFERRMLGLFDKY